MSMNIGGASPSDPVDEIEEVITRLLELIAPRRNRHLYKEMFTTISSMASADTDTLDLKITSGALAEMHEAYEMFRPYRERRKVTVFGSARTAPHDPLYRQTEDVAKVISDAGWMVVTGAGPGIMEAGMRGAGREASIGVSIRLPNEQQANPVIQDDPKHVAMRYFFTRKLMLVKESHGFICMPGGYGTLDETFELLTLTQTGKGVPVPIVLLDVPGDRYWSEVEDFIRDQLASRQLVSSNDLDLFVRTDSSAVAANAILDFYRNYHSMRYVGELIILRLQREPSTTQLELLNEEFNSIVHQDQIRVLDPATSARRDPGETGLVRLAFPFGRHDFGDLHRLIRAVNRF